jgi:sugar-specific transcriptional regulator TrmB
MADFLEEKKNEIQARLKELRPLVEEYQRLEAAAQALEGVNANGTAAAPRRARRGRPAATAAKGTGKRGRPRGTGTRSKEALALVRKQPGITIPEIAAAMKIKQNYLYRVLPSLAQDGLVKKQGRGWHPKDAA